MNSCILFNRNTVSNFSLQIFDFVVSLVKVYTVRKETVIIFFIRGKIVTTVVILKTPWS